MIDADSINGEFAFEIAFIVEQYPNNLKGLRKMKYYHSNLFI